MFAAVVVVAHVVITVKRLTVFSVFITSQLLLLDLKRAVVVLLQHERRDQSFNILSRFSRQERKCPESKTVENQSRYTKLPKQVLFINTFYQASIGDDFC
jgi:hypothetical protein